jgi:hypothetical protein
MGPVASRLAHRVALTCVNSLPDVIPRPQAQKLPVGHRPRTSLAVDIGPASGETDADGEEAPGARGLGHRWYEGVNSWDLV